MMRFYHEPGALHVQAAFISAAVCIACLYVLFRIVMKDLKPDNFRHEILPESTVSDDDGDEVIVVGVLPPADGKQGHRAWTRNRKLIAFAFICAATCFVGLGVHWRHILSNWQQGDVYLKNREYVRAERAYQRALAFDLESRVSRIKLARAYIAENRRDLAEPQLRIAVNGEDTDSTPYILLGDCLMAANEPEKAEQLYRSAIRISPRSSECYVLAGLSLLRMHRVHDAENELYYAAQIDPKSYRALGYLGSIQASTGRSALGIANLKKAILLKPEDVNSHNMLANTYSRLNMHAEAAAEYRAEIAANPEFTIAYYNLGHALTQLNQLPESIVAYETYLRKCQQHPGPAMIGVPEAMRQLAELRRKVYTSMRL